MSHGLRCSRAAVGSVLARAIRFVGAARCFAAGSRAGRRTWGACKHGASRLGILFLQMIEKRRFRRLACSALFALAVFLACAEWAVTHAAAGRIYDSADGPPPADVALVLGTARKLRNGAPNLYYAPRLEVAAELFRLGKVRGIIVSGDNSRSNYSEPDDMKADLVVRGVPAQFVTCDYAGFSTHDSMQRVSRVFGQSRLIVVSQRFHVERALFLARADGLDAIGCAAAEVPLRWRIRVRLREVLSRGKAVLDVACGRGPKFLGPRELVLLAGGDDPPVNPQTGVQ